MAGSVLSLPKASGAGMDSSENFCEGVHIFVPVLVGFAEVEKPLMKLCHHLISRVGGFLDIGEGAGREVLSVDVMDMVQEEAMAFEFVFCLVCLSIPQVLLVDTFFLGGIGGDGLNGNI